MKFLRYWVPVICWAGLIFLFSSLSIQPVSRIFWQEFLVKKSVHIVEYFVLFILVYRAMLNTTAAGRKPLAAAFCLAVLYGVIDEYHQSFVPGREARVRDVLVDSVGAGIALVWIWRYLAKAPGRLANWAKILEIS